MKKLIFCLLMFAQAVLAQTGTETIDYSNGSGDKGSFTVNQIRGSQNAGTVTAVSGNGTGGATVTVATGTTTPVVTVALGNIPNASLSNSSVTVAGKTVPLGGSATVGFADLTGGAALGQLPTGIPNSNLANSGMTIEGTVVPLGGAYVAGSIMVSATGTEPNTVRLIRCNAGTTDIVRTLPAAPTDGVTVTYKRINSSAGNTVIIPNTGQTLSEGTQVKLVSQGRAVQFQYNLGSTQWQIID
jgi:hypothetical protein